MLIERFLMDIVVNVALFGVAAVFIGRVHSQLTTSRDWQYRIALGGVLGLTAAVCMQFPFEAQPGVVFDGRAIAVAAAGLFGGPVAGLAAIWPPGLYRVWLGGDGALPGLINLALAAGLGALIRAWAIREAEQVCPRHIFVAAALLPLASYLAFPFFPTNELAWQVFHSVGPTLADRRLRDLAYGSRGREKWRFADLR